MYEQIEQVARKLGDVRAGWATRKDAAETLGRVSQEALSVLKSHEEDADVDVQRVVGQALATASAGLAGIEPAKEAPAPPLKELVQACEKKGKRAVEPDGDGYAVTVQLKGGRHQKVYVSPTKRKDGVELVRVFTYCGAPTDDSLEWSLRTNAKLERGALALLDEDGEPRLALLACFVASKLTLKELKTSIRELSHYGDWIESKLTGLDDF